MKAFHDCETGYSRRIPGPTDAYEELVASLAACRDIIERLEAEPASPKRDASLELVRETQGRILMALRNVVPTS